MLFVLGSKFSTFKKIRPDYMDSIDFCAVQSLKTNKEK